LRQRVKRANDRESPDEFWNHSERKQIFRLDMPDRFCPQRLFVFQVRTSEAHHFLADALLDDFVETDECAAANEKDLLRVDLNVFLMRMLAAALRRDIAGAAFE